MRIKEQERRLTFHEHDDDDDDDGDGDVPVFPVTESKPFICPPYDVVLFQKGIILKERCLLFGKMSMVSSLNTFVRAPFYCSSL